MPITEFYRYISHPLEKRQIIESRVIRSANPFSFGTWYTPNRYDNARAAQQFLSLPDEPTNRIGPIENYKIPNFNIVPLRLVAPAYGQPGGGLEACTSYTIYLFGLLDFNSGTFEI